MSIIIQQKRLHKILIIVCFLISLGCNNHPTRELVLFDFESDSDLDRVHWKCHTFFSLSDRYVTHGRGSLRLELYPSDYPGLNPMLKDKDWRGYKTLCFDIYNTAKKEIRITIRIDDKEENPPYADRYNKSFMLKPGMNHMQLRLDSLMTSGTGRKLNLKKIHSFLIFMVNPARKVVLYLDYLRLVPLL